MAKKTDKIVKKLIEEQQSLGKDLVQMYQAGFLDSYKKYIGRVGKRYRKIIAKINKDCQESFEKRFMEKIDKEIKKHGKTKQR